MNLSLAQENYLQKLRVEREIQEALLVEEEPIRARQDAIAMIRAILDATDISGQKKEP